MEELNQHTDLTVKLNNQSKLCKMLETNDDFFAAKGQSDQSTAQSTLLATSAAGVEQLNEAQQERIKELTIIDLMDRCKGELQGLQEAKEKAIEEFLEK